MIAALAILLTAASLLLTGAMAGFFYAYGVSVMPGLDMSDPRHGIPVMQAVNQAVRNPVFFVTFFATPGVCLLAGGFLALLGRRGAAWALAAAGLVYLLGAFLPTSLVNVPLNEALAVVLPPEDPDLAEGIWTPYSADWRLWNHLRTAGSAFSLLLTGLGLFLWGRSVAGSRGD